jgi:hypothetical protein
VRRRRALLGLAVAVAFGVLLTACGLPKDASPRTIAADKVPFSLLAPTSSVPAEDQTGGPVEDLYYFDGATLRPVVLAVASRTPLDVLRQLVEGVPDATNGVATAIPKDTQVLAADLDENGVLHVTLNEQILSIKDPDQGRAFGQMVWTATGLDGVRQVLFRTQDANGQQNDVDPTTDTGHRAEPLDKSDFRSIAPS